MKKKKRVSNFFLIFQLLEINEKKKKKFLQNRMGYCPIILKKKKLYCNIEIVLQETREGWARETVLQEGVGLAKIVLQ